MHTERRKSRRERFICVVIAATISGLMPMMSLALEELVLGVSFTDSEKLQEAYAPFVEYLSTALDVPVRLAIEQDYGLFAEKLVAGEIGMGFFGPVLYVETKAAHPEEIHYVATCMQEIGGQARAFYYGYFVVNATSPYHSLRDLKGKKWGFTSTHSSSGYQYPMAFFSRKQIVPEEYFSDVKFLRTHSNVTNALAAWKAGAANQIDGGATWDVNLLEAEGIHGDIFRKIARVGPIPLLPVVVSGEVKRDSALMERLKQALAAPPEDVLQAEGFPYVGWKIGSDRDFDITRKVVNMGK